MNIHQERAIEKVKYTFKELGLPDYLGDYFEQYVLGELEEGAFLKMLPKISLTQRSYMQNYALKKCFADLWGLNDCLKEYLKAMIHIGGKTAIREMMVSYVVQEVYVKAMIENEVPMAYIIAALADYSVDREQLSVAFINDLNFAYEKAPEAFKVAFRESLNMCDELSQMYITLFMYYKDSANRDLKKELESMMKSYLRRFLTGKLLKEEDIKEVEKYIQGGLFVTDKCLEPLRAKMRAKSIESTSQRALMGAAYIISPGSDFAKRFLKFSLLTLPESAFDALDTFLNHEMMSEIGDLCKGLDIPMEYYIAWLGEKYAAVHYRHDKKEIRELLERYAKSCWKVFEKAAAMSDGNSSIYLAKYLWNEGQGQKHIPIAEKKCIQTFVNFMENQKVPQNVYQDFKDYLAGEKDFEAVRGQARSLFGNQRLHIYGGQFFRPLLQLQGVSELFERNIRLYGAMGSYDILESIYSTYKNFEHEEMGLEAFIDILKHCDVDIEGLLPFVATWAVIHTAPEQREAAVRVLEDMAQNDTESFTRAIKGCSAEARAFSLEFLYAFNKQIAIPLLVDYLEDTSKAVKETVIRLLVETPEAHDIIVPLLTAKKQGIRENAVKVLSKWRLDAAKEALQRALEGEKSEKIRLLMMEALQIQDNSQEENEVVDILEYCRKAVKGGKKAALNWIETETLPKIRLRDSVDFADLDIVKFMLLAYASQNEISISKEAEKACQYLNEKDMEVLAEEVLQRWLSQGAESKKKWVLAFAAVFGGYDAIVILKKHIEEWPQNARGAIACEAVRALALNGSDEALLIVDGISRKFKFKQVKEAAAKALDFAAEQMGMEREELSDRIVPTLGFDIRGERILDYGDRKFTLRLTPELTPEVYDESDKKLKSLPAPAKKDDAEKAAEAYEAFKLLKKQLKSALTTQTIRLESALSVNRKWTKESWEKLFVQNPIMHQFAIGLVWGVYEGDSLTDTFRYMEDGTFNTKDEDEYEMPNHAMVGLVHPIELTEEDLALWREQLENYEVKQPIEQLHRGIYRVTEEEQELEQIERFGGIQLNGLSLLGKMTAYGWYRGSVQDAGFYYQFYKEDKKLELGVELNFSGVGVGYENEDVTVHTLTFYKAGTVERGSYVYDTVKAQHLIKPKDVPERFFSEILYQVDKALVSKIGVNENWREDVR